MIFIHVHNRNQITIFPVSLDQGIDPDNEVRVIDLFVESLYIKITDSEQTFLKTTARHIILQIFSGSSFMGIYKERHFYRQQGDK